MPAPLYKGRAAARRVAVLVACCALLLLPGLGTITVQREQELRVVVTARHMAEGGSWLVPEFLGHYRFRKPPLMYWIVASAFKAAGTTASAFVARAPGTVSGTALIVTIFLFGARLVGRKRAWLASVMGMTTFLFIRHARLMETDITLSLCVTITAISGYLALTRPREALRWWTMAGFAGGIGFLAKGPAALAMPPLAWLAFAALEPRRLKSLIDVRAVPGILACALIAAPWYIAIRSLAREQIAIELSATFTESHHPGPFVYYFYTLLHATLPWCVLLPFALWAAFKHARHHQGVRFLLAWFVTSFIALSSIDSKQIHYCTLLLPQTALILGWFMARLLARRRADTRAFLLWYGHVMVVAPMAFLTAVYAVDWHPSQDDDYLIQQFTREAHPQIVAAHRLFIAGPDVAALEFYSGRKPQYPVSLEQAWSQAAPDDVILYSGNHKFPIDHGTLPATPVMEMKNRKAEFILLRKNGTPSP